MENQYRTWYLRNGCYHPEDCTSCIWCGFKDPDEDKLPPVFGFVKRPSGPHSLAKSEEAAASHTPQEQSND